jgi:hypothetical protein
LFFRWYFCLDTKVSKKSRKYIANLRTGHSLTPPYFLANAPLLLRSNQFGIGPLFNSERYFLVFLRFSKETDKKPSQY